jgi:hypothetical protein
MTDFGPVLQIDGSRRPDTLDIRALLDAMSRKVSENYASAIDAIRMRATTSADSRVNTALAEVANLLMQHAEIHRALSNADSGAQIEVVGYLRGLCRSIGLSRLRGRQIRLLFIESRSQLLSSERCRQLGLAVSEMLEDLAANVGTRGGVVSIELVNNDAMIKCCVRHRGIWLQSRPDRRADLISALVKNIGGFVEGWHEGETGEAVISVPSVGATRRPAAAWPDAFVEMSAM